MMTHVGVETSKINELSPKRYVSFYDCHTFPNQNKNIVLNSLHYDVSGQNE